MNIPSPADPLATIQSELASVSNYSGNFFVTPSSLRDAFNYAYQAITSQIPTGDGTRTLMYTALFGIGNSLAALLESSNPTQPSGSDNSTDNSPNNSEDTPNV